jgi:hypothetical protein
MLHNKVRLAALAGCAVSALVIAGCGAREPVEAPPATLDPGYGSTARTPDLMGAPPTAEATPADGLLGGPGPKAATAPTPVTVTTDNPNLRTWRRADGTLVTSMAPIANPKGPRQIRYTPRAAAPVRRVHAAYSPVTHPVARPATHAVIKPVVAARPAPKPLPVAKPAPKPVVVAAAPAPLKPVVAAKPVVTPAKPVVVPVTPAAKAPVLAAPAKPLTKVQTLQAAVAPAATQGAVLAPAASLAQGKEGQVTLSLPATLGDLIKTEAAKLGLGKAAKKTSAYADLQGEGYDITPNGRQTTVVKPGEPATFAWQVKPTPTAKGALKTEFGIELGGAKPLQRFSLGSIAKQVVPIQEAVKEKAKGFKLPSLGRYESVDLPGVGKVPGKSLLGGALVLLALLILVAISRNASAAKARTERRRKFRTLTDYGRNEMDFDSPKTAEVNYVNPMVAAAGGALAGAAVATAVSHHGDHDHATDPVEHNPFTAPFTHGHDDHHAAPVVGVEPLPVSAHAPIEAHLADHVADHGQDDHGHAPEVHAPETQAPEVQVEADHHDDHGRAAPPAHKEAEHKELEHTH